MPKLQKTSFLKQKTKLIRVILLVLIVSTLGVLVYSLNSKQVKGWYNDNWLYRTPFYITGSADTNKKIKLDIDTSTLIAAGKMQADCGDSRFTTATGELLKYYIDTSGGACDTASTDYYVLVPTFINGDTLIYHYYGNPNAVNGSEGSQFSEATYTPSGTSSGSEQNSPGPSLYLKFDEANGSVAYDSTENSYDGTFNNDPSWAGEESCISSTCLQFDGDNDYLQFNTLGEQSYDDFTISVWYKSTVDTSPDDQYIFIHGDPNASSPNDDTVIFRLSDDPGYEDVLQVYLISNGSTVDDYYGSIDVVDRQWHHLAAVRESGTITIYVDGQPDTTTSCTNVCGTVTIDTDTTDAYMGDDPGITEQLNGYLDEFKLHKYARSANEILLDYTGTISGGAGAVFGASTTSSLSSGLMGYFKMNDIGVDAEGEQLTDSSGSGNTSTLYGNNGVGDNGTGMSCIASGKYDTGCDFDGTDDYTVSTTNFSSQAMSFSLWFNADLYNDNHYLLNKYLSSSEAWGVRVDASGQVEVYDDIDSHSSPYYASSDSQTTAGTWNHVVAGVDADGTNYLYVNGNLVGSSHISTGNLASFSGDLYFGARRTSSQFFNGKIDDVRIYNRLLTKNEVLSLYNLAPPPIVYYDFNQGSGTTSVNDSSGNGNSSTMQGSMTESDWVSGKYSYALDFDGTDDRLVLNNSDDFINYDQFSICTWVYPRDVIDGSNIFTIFSQDVSSTGRYTHFFAIHNDGRLIYDNYEPIGGNISGDTILTENEWQHICVTRDTSNNVKLYLNGVVDGSGTGETRQTAGSVNITNIGSRFVSSSAIHKFNGLMDEFKIYDYGLTQNQVLSDMNAGLPFNDEVQPYIYYDFNDGFRDTLYDQSGRELNGDLAGSSATCPATGSCPLWSKEGKLGSALSFDGSDDYVIIDDSDLFTFGDGASTDQPFSISFWVNMGDATSLDFVNKVTNSGGLYPEWAMFTDGDDYLFLELYDINFSNYIGRRTTSAVTSYEGEWVHILGTYDGSSSVSGINLYINGVLQPMTNDVLGSYSAMHNQISDVVIGAWLETSAEIYADVVIDELKFFNAELSAQQVKNEYEKSLTPIVMGATSTNSDGSTPSFSDNRAYCPPGFTGTCSAPIFEMGFDDTNGTTIYDTSGSGITADLGNNNGTDYSAGVVGRAVDIFGETLFSVPDQDYVSVDTSTTIDDLFNGGGSLSIWAKIRDPRPGGSVGGMVLHKTGTSGEVWRLNTNVATGDNYSVRFYHSFSGDDANWDTPSSSTFPINEWAHIVVTYDSSSVLNDPNIYVNGVLYTEDETPTGTADSDSGGDLTIGTNFSNAPSDALFDEVMLFDYEMSKEQVMWLYNNGGPVVHYKFNECQGTTINDYAINKAGDYEANNGSLTLGGGNTLVAEYDFDEGTGSTAADSSGNGNTGTLTNMDSSDWVTRGSGSALDFDGVDDYINIPRDSAFEPSDAISVTTWFNWDDHTASTWGKIVSKSKDDGNAPYTSYSLTQNNNNQTIQFEMNINGSLYQTTPYSINEDTWYHLAGTWSSDTQELRLYVDGVEVADNAGNSGTITYYDVPLRIGYSSRGEANTQIDGIIDEVKVYDFELTSTQVNTVKNGGDITGLGQVAAGVCNDGSNTYWGNGTSGKNNSAGSFDGADDEVTVSNTISDVKSVSFWVNPATTTESVIDLSGSEYIEISSGVVSTTGITSPTIYVNGVESTSISAGVWSHITVTTATEFDADAISIGSVGANFFDGLLDDVKIFNYQLNDTQVKLNYNEGSAVVFD